MEKRYNRARNELRWNRFPQGILWEGGYFSQYAYCASGVVKIEKVSEFRKIPGPLSIKNR